MELQKDWKEPKILALVGKGGVGKTTLSAAFVRVLSEREPDARILAIDADPAIGLAIALGVEVRQTLDEIRCEIIDTAKTGAGRAAVELLGEVRFRIFDALVETDRFAFLAIGRPEGAGCYCAVNAYLKEVIDMVSQRFDYVVIDGEAGIEQINRRVMEKVSHLFLISDESYKGLQVLKTIQKVAQDLVSYEKGGIVINRAESVQELEGIDELDFPLLGVIGSDRDLAQNDRKGQSIFALQEEAVVLQEAKKILEKMEI